MASSDPVDRLEERVAEWRSYFRRRQTIHSADVEELEDHLRDEVASLSAAGLTTDEAFVVAVTRIGALDALAKEFAREHSDRLWKQLVTPTDAPASGGASRREVTVVFGLAVAAALAVKVPELFGLHLMGGAEWFYMRNMSLFVLPFLTGYFAWKRKLPGRTAAWLVLPFVAAAVFANVFPFAPQSDTSRLTALHLPIALWLAVGIAYAGSRWSEADGRMDFIRYSGELFIYYVLIALGGGVLTALTIVMFEAAGLDVEDLVQAWLVPCGALGAVIVGSWLVEAKQSVIENMAPVLTRLFTPLFTIVLVAFLVTMAATSRGIDVDRNVLIVFDLLLAVVVALLLYQISARDPGVPPGAFDRLQLVLVIAALAVDGLALAAIASRISEFGFTPNRVAALGENVVLLVNLAWSAVLSVRFLRGRAAFGDLERWQTAYLPVYSAWAALVVVAFPLLFGAR